MNYLLVVQKVVKLKYISGWMKSFNEFHKINSVTNFISLDTIHQDKKNYK